MMPLSYVFDRPVEGEEFVVPHDIVKHIQEDLLEATAESKYFALIIRGWRKSGKTSLLKYLESHYSSKESVVPVYFDLDGRSNQTLSDLYADLAKATYRAVIGDTSNNLQPPTSITTFRTFLSEKIEGRLDSSQLLLLIDEFEHFDQDSVAHLDDATAYKSFYSNLSDLISSRQYIRAVIAVGKQPTDWQKNYSREFFQHGGNHHFSQQKSLSAMTDKESLKILRFGSHKNGGADELELSALETSGKWPLLLQLVGYVWKKTSDNRPWKVEYEETGTLEVLRIGKGQLDQMWAGLTIEERLYLSFLIHNSQPNERKSEIEVKKLIQKYEKRLHGKNILKASRWLIERGILKRHGQDTYLFSSQIWEQYVRNEHEFISVLLEIDEVANTAAHFKYQNASGLVKLQRTEEAVKVLISVLQENPNHLQARLLLGDLWMKRQQADEAIDQFSEAYIQIPEVTAHSLATAFLQKAEQLGERGKNHEAFDFANRANELPYLKSGDSNNLVNKIKLARRKYAKLLGEDAYRAKDFVQAKKYYELAKEKDLLELVVHELSILDTEAHIDRLKNNNAWDGVIKQLEGLIRNHTEHERIPDWHKQKEEAKLALDFDEAKNLLARKEWREAKGILNEIIKVAPYYQQNNKMAANMLIEAKLEERTQNFVSEKKWHDAALTYDYLCQLFAQHECQPDWKQAARRYQQNQNWAERFDRGVDFLLQHDWQKALNQFKGLPPNYEKDDINAVHLIQMASLEETASAHWKKQFWQKARTDYRELLTQFSQIKLHESNLKQRWEYHIQICDREMELEQLVKEAEHHIDFQEWEKVSEKLDSWQKIRQAYEQSNEVRLAVALEERVAKLTQQKDLEELAQNRHRSQQWEEAGRHYESLLQLFPNASKTVRQRWEKGLRENKMEQTHLQWYKFARTSLDYRDWHQAQNWLDKFEDTNYQQGGVTVSELKSLASLEKAVKEAEVDEDWAAARDTLGQLLNRFKSHSQQQNWERKYREYNHKSKLYEIFERGEKDLEGRKVAEARQRFSSVVEDDASFAYKGLYASAYLEQATLEVEASTYENQEKYQDAIHVYDKLLDIVQHAKRKNYVLEWEEKRSKAIKNHLQQQNNQSQIAIKNESWVEAIYALTAFTAAKEKYENATNTPQHQWLRHAQVEKEADELVNDSNWLLARKKYEGLLHDFPNEDEALFVNRWENKVNEFYQSGEQYNNFQDGLHSIDRALKNKPVDKLILRQAVKPLEKIPDPTNYENLIQADLLTRLTTDRAKRNHLWTVLFLVGFGILAAISFLGGSRQGSLNTIATEQINQNALIAAISNLEATGTFQANQYISATATIEQLDATVFELTESIQEKNITATSQEIIINELDGTVTAQAANIIGLRATVDSREIAIAEAAETIQSQVVQEEILEATLEHRFVVKADIRENDGIVRLYASPEVGSDRIEGDIAGKTVNIIGSNFDASGNLFYVVNEVDGDTLSEFTQNNNDGPVDKGYIRPSQIQTDSLVVKGNETPTPSSP